MPTPSWSFTYNMAQTPEANGFTRLIHSPDPIITLVTSGTPANRRIEVNTDGGGDLICLINNVPSFSVANGMTAEALINVAGAGDVGFEARFIGLAISVSIFSGKVRLEIPFSQTTPTYVEAATAANNADILWRTTFDGSNARIYRAGVLVLGPVSMIVKVGEMPQANFMFWFEGGGTGIIKSMNFFIGGPVVP